MARYRLDDEVICQATSMPGDAASINPDKAPLWVIGYRFWAPDFECPQRPVCRVRAMSASPPENGQIAAPH
jgi:hypothetical protein